MKYFFLALFLALSTPVSADQGDFEPGTQYEDMDLEPDTWIPFNDLYLQQLRRSRFDKKDPNYYWLFNKCPCCYEEIWSSKWPCPTEKPPIVKPPIVEPPKDVPEPPVLALLGAGMIFTALKRR